MEKFKIILYMSYFVCAVSLIIFFYSYENQPEPVPIHQSIEGEIDRWGNKKNLLIIPILSLTIVVAISYLTRKPDLLNYPIEVTELNREKMYRNVKILLSLVSLFITSLFLVLIMQSFHLFNLTFGVGFFVTYIVILSIVPMIVIRFIGK